MSSALHFGHFSAPEFSSILDDKLEGRKVLLMVDENTHALCLPILSAYLKNFSGIEIIELPSGEENKTMEMCMPVWETLTECQFSRNDVLVALGGGVICDMAGLIAGLYKRGMDCILIPTTLLSMVDASVGGKTGIDLGPFKNQLGLFKEPESIFFDIQFLGTLPSKERTNGFAEMIKHACIDKDWSRFEELTNSTNLEVSLDLIQQSVFSKKTIVDADPFEKGIRKILNLGHTVAHAIEGYCLSSEEKNMDHGEAVAHGLVIEALMSNKMGRLSENDYRYLRTELEKMYDWRKFSELAIDRMMELMKNDKKNMAETPEFVLFENLSKISFSVKVPTKIVREAMQEILLID